MKLLTLLALFSFMLMGCQNQTAEPTPKLEATSEEVIEGCTKDLKVCPDGQSVGRNKDNLCEFFACPAAIDACQDDMKQCADGSFVFRDAKNNCEFKPCAEFPVDEQDTISENGCSSEVNKCSDGGKVGRDPDNNCEFYACDSVHKIMPPKAMMCTQEVKECTDGSFVGRDSYNGCAFKPCPEGFELKDAKVE
ncbi:MAG: hypothetical protein ACSHWU_04535 [Marinicella sp.]